MITVVLLALVAGSLVFTLLAMEAARRYMAHRRPGAGLRQPISILKPLAGLDEGLEENLRSFFTQDYPDFEILLAVSTEADASLPLARRMQAEFPHIPCRIVITGEPPYPNRKVASIHAMAQQARHDLLLMSDSDIRVTSDMLSRIDAEFSSPTLMLTTCPYRAVPGNSPWSKLEAVMMNTEFLAGILTARLLEGMRFAVGPTIACRKQALQAIGGFETLRDFLAEDFVFGQRVAEAGLEVGLSAYVVEHRIGSASFRHNADHRLRWVRSTRRSRPAGYAGQLFTYPVPLAMLLTAWSLSWWPVLALAVALRLTSAWQTAVLILKDPIIKRAPLLVPLQDVLSFAFWLAGFLGNTIHWRGKTFYLERDGRFRQL
ncbi:MAG: bacteriohopanetetrol glucosamine biosynthesis glycosyltransferase HpnI [Bryobacterales bacterium]|nr:bacteriohopanetetrol glucosamine biosynthesis glycosyltransferase HpnI [Bryobacterales bacterium]